VNETLFSEHLASNEIEGDGITVPARHDDNVVAMRLSKISPSLNGDRLGCLTTRNQVNAAMLSVGPQAGIH
jgi:hypothetical protein